MSSVFLCIFLCCFILHEINFTYTFLFEGTFGCLVRHSPHSWSKQSPVHSALWCETEACKKSPRSGLSLVLSSRRSSLPAVVNSLAVTLRVRLRSVTAVMRVRDLRAQVFFSLTFGERGMPFLFYFGARQLLNSLRSLGCGDM